MSPVHYVVAPLVAALLLALAAPSGSAAPTAGAAELLIEIDKSSQSMTVSRDGEALHRWPVSTGTQRYDTPAGTFTPFRMEKDHFSREWDDAPMPHSIFFTKKGHAIHGTTHRRAIGRPASHGCVRLERQNARVLFALVRRAGMANTRVVLSGETPAAAPPAANPPAKSPPAKSPPMVARRAPPEKRPPAMHPPRLDEREAPPPERERGADRVQRIEADPGYWVTFPDGRRVFHPGYYRPDPSLPPAPPPPANFPGFPLERNR